MTSITIRFSGRTHLFWAINQTSAGDWVIQRAGRVAHGTSYDKPLPNHRFKTKKEAIEFKRKHLV